MKTFKSLAAFCLVLLLLLNIFGGLAIAAVSPQDNTAKNTNPFAPSNGNLPAGEATLAIGFIYIGTDSASSGTHSFVEIYNPNDFTVTLTDTYSLQYKSMAPSGAEYVTSDWIKLNLEGEIPAYHSFLVNLGETGALPSGSGRLDLTDVTFDQDFVWPAGIKGYNKGVKFVLMSNQDLLPSSLLNPFTGDGAGQVDGYVDMYGVSGNDNTAPSVDGYETERILANAADAQSKQKGFVRINIESGIKYKDTDNNLNDFQQVDFRTSDITNSSLIPRSLEDGAWTQAMIETFAAETLTLQPGSSEHDLNFNWYSSRNDNTASIVQIAKKSDMNGGLFPTVGVITVTGTVGDASAEKSWHKAGVTGLDLNTEYVYRVSNDNIILNRFNKNGGTPFPKSSNACQEKRTPFFNRFKK
ncbi:MAG: fibronectin type III domain-containing protein [Methanimicrococcus sp.]|nr:fibronectin type III domain-containing protein [Methanimicrococcus sp.]